MIDENGLRLNVGIILANKEGKLFWGRRAGRPNAWQFPQGGIHINETPEQAMYRELNEEVGLLSHHVEILSSTDRWLRYYLPHYLRRYHSKPFCIGQKQKWFLLRLIGNEEDICLDSCDPPEFDSWRWIDYWQPTREVIIFKRQVYKNALRQFEKIILKT